MQPLFVDAATGLTLRVVTPADTESVVDAWWEWFIADEPATVSLGGYGGARNDAMSSQCRHCLDEGVSVLAADASGVLVGFFVCHVLERKKDRGAAPTLAEYEAIYPAVHAQLMDACTVMYHPGA